MVRQCLCLRPPVSLSHHHHLWVLGVRLDVCEGGLEAAGQHLAPTPQVDWVLSGFEATESSPTDTHFTGTV